MQTLNQPIWKNILKKIRTWARVNSPWVIH